MINAVSYQFNKFVEFAEERVKAGKESAIARTGEVRIGAGTPLEERAIYSTDKTDFVGMTLLRGGDAKRANDEVRELFKKSIVDMFGGEENIPDSVKDAMLLKDYGSGKPLTARRILEVNNAIEALGRTNIFHPYQSSEALSSLENLAFDNGYKRTDFGKLNMAANFLMKGLNLDAKTALAAVVTKGSPANRAMNAGGAYMKDAKSFMLGYDIFNKIEDCNRSIRDNASKAGAEAAKNHPEISHHQATQVAKNLEIKAGLLHDYVENYIEGAKLPKDIFSDVLRHFNSYAEDMRTVVYHIDNDGISDRKLYTDLIDKDDSQYLRNCLLPLEMKVREEKKDTPAVQEFFKRLHDLVKEMHAEHEELRNAYKSAFADASRDGLKNKLMNTVHEKGFESGTPGTVPQGILEDIDKSLGEDPFGTIDKVDAFCAYIEKNGQVELRFTQKQKGDIRSLMLTFLGREKGEKAFQNFLDKYETQFFKERFRVPKDNSIYKAPTPESVYKHFMEHRDELLKFAPDSKQGAK